MADGHPGAEPLVTATGEVTLSLRSDQSSRTERTSDSSRTQRTSDTLIDVPRCGPVTFSHGWWVRVEFEELSRLQNVVISNKFKKIMRQYLWPINILRLGSIFFFAIFALIFSIVWLAWLKDIFFADGPIECTKEKTLEPIVWTHRIARLVCLSIGVTMQLCLQFYFRSQRRMNRLETKLNAVSMAGACMRFKLVPYRTVDHVFNCTFFVKKSQSELKRAYRNKVDLFELTLEDEECPIPKSRPLKSCEDCLLEDVASCLADKVTRFKDSVEQAKLSADNLAVEKADLIRRCKLDFDMVLAVVMYTFDLETFGDTFKAEENFYYNLNLMYRDIQGDFWASCSGYLFYLLEALRRLDAFRLPEGAFLYRGVDRKCASRVRKRYKQGMTIVWAAFSSAATEESIAADFAEDGGLVFRIRLLARDSSSRDISELSMYQNEQEVLLLPNFTCRVDSQGPHKVDGVEYVDLVEVGHNSLVS